MNVKTLFAYYFSHCLFKLNCSLYVNKFVISFENLLDECYLISIASMLFGSTLRGNVVGIEDFYNNIKRNENRYLYSLSLSASLYETTLP